MKVIIGWNIVASIKDVKNERLEGDLDARLVKRLSHDFDSFLNGSSEDDFWFDENVNPIYPLVKRKREKGPEGIENRWGRRRKLKRLMYVMLPIVFASVGVVFFLTIGFKQEGQPSSSIAKVENTISSKGDQEKLEPPFFVDDVANPLTKVRDCVVEKLLVASSEVEFFQVDMFGDILDQSTSEPSETINSDEGNQSVLPGEIASREITDGERSSQLDPSNEITKFAVSLSPTLYLMNQIQENL